MWPGHRCPLETGGHRGHMARDREGGSGQAHKRGHCDEGCPGAVGGNQERVWESFQEDAVKRRQQISKFTGQRNIVRNEILKFGIPS